MMRNWKAQRLRKLDVETADTDGVAMNPTPPWRIFDPAGSEHHERCALRGEA